MYVGKLLNVCSCKGAPVRSAGPTPVPSTELRGGVNKDAKVKKIITDPQITQITRIR